MREEVTTRQRTRDNRTMPKVRVHIGIDNGPSGSIGLICVGDSFRAAHFSPMIVRKEQNYTKAKQNITRVDLLRLIEWTIERVPHQILRPNIHVMMERPMVNPRRFKATTSALRALEATLWAVEIMKLSHSYIDSKEWQKELLPKGTKGTSELKKASMDIGIRLFPEHKEIVEKHGDADGLLIAEYCRRTL